MSFVLQCERMHLQVPFPTELGDTFTDGAFKWQMYCFILGDAEQMQQRRDAGPLQPSSRPTAYAGKSHANPAYRYSGPHAGGPANDRIEW